MAAMQTEERAVEPHSTSRDWTRFDVLLAESRFHLERVRVHMARAEILRLLEALEWERARRRRGLFGRRF